MNINEQIKKLKKQKNAIILAHTYQVGDVQDVADYVGDSYGLSQMALTMETSADIIVFCGVHFMAETAKITCPDKTVLLPDIESGCPMADMVTAEKLEALKKQYPEAFVMTYINSSARVKAVSDVICTSSNAVKIANNVKNKQIIFAPDKFLGSYVSEHTPNKEFILYDGYCNVHIKILAEDIIHLKKQHPNAVVLAHPECTKEVLKEADEILSTTGIIAFAGKSDKNDFIIATESGIMHQLEKQYPSKNFYHVSYLAVCPNMKKNTIEKVLIALEEEKFKIEVDPIIAKKAKIAIDRMFEYAK